MNKIPVLIKTLKLAGINATQENEGILLKDMLGLQVKVSIANENSPEYIANFRTWHIWVIYPEISLERNIRWNAIMASIVGIILIFLANEPSIESLKWIKLTGIFCFIMLLNLVVLSIVVSRYNLIVSIISRSLNDSVE